MQPDRRDHLRIPDSIFVEYRVVGRGEVFGDESGLPYPVTSRFLLLRDLYRVELEAEQLLREMQRTDEKLAGFLRTVDRRLTMMARVLSAEEADPSTRPAADVTLGEGGLSFRVPELLQEGTLLGMKLLFDSSLLGLVSFGDVRYSRLSDEGDGYVIGVRFLQQDHLTQEVLARHIVHRQAEARRERLARDAAAGTDPF